MVIPRRPLYFNSDAHKWHSSPSADLEDVFHFHKSLPGYNQTDLIPLDSLAQELNLGKVYVKHEGDRLGLPSFKILGASWGTYRAVLRAFNLPVGADIKAIQAATASSTTALFAATDGNHGRAVARLAQMFGMPARIFVPANMDANMITSIRNEGAEVVNTGKSYDDAILEAARGSAAEKGLLIQDCGFDDYQELPEWIVDGYSTCLREIDMQLGEETADLVIVPAGVGSLAQAVVTHYRRQGSATTVMAVEPDSAACLWKSLREGESVSIRTTPTIMNGLDCGTVSTTSWPILQSGIGAAVTIADQESHEAITDFDNWGVHTGPCGAASLAALRRLGAVDKDTLGLTKDSVVVLLSTEAARPYKIPKDTRLEDPAQLVEQLTNIMSISSRSGKHERPVETSIAEYVMAWLEHRDIECHWLENITGRPSVVGVVRGNEDGKSLMLHGNLDVKTSADTPPLGSGKARIHGTRVYGDGAANMKGGLAANMLTLARAKAMNLRGDVILTAVAGGNGADVGIEQVLAAEWRAHGAVVTKPTGVNLVGNSNGTVSLEVDVHNGPDAPDGFVDLETDPITQAAYFLVELDKCRRKKSGTPVELRDGLQRVSVLEPGANSASCTIALEWQMVAGETADGVEQAIQKVLDMVSQKKPSFRFSLRVISSHDPFSTALSHPFVSLISEAIGGVRKQTSGPAADIEWADCAALSEAGIPLIAWGPVGAASNASKGNEEWVDVESVIRIADGLMAIVKEFCA
jgi:diaminopropionate ammonia-lyase family